jgi:hypothetical protein
MQRAQLPVDEDESEATLVARFGAVVGGGVLTAIMASLPAALRIGDGGLIGRALEQWLALAALLTGPAILFVFVARRARVGMRLLAGERAPILIAGLLWWCVLELGLLAIFGGLLRKNTHHHGLAGVTFAAFAVFSGAAIAILAIRATRLLGRADRKIQRIALVITSAAAFLAIVVVGIRTGRAPALSTAAALVDASAIVLSASVLSSRAVAHVRAITIGGVPAGVLVLILGVSSLIAEPKVREAIAGHAPIHAWFLGSVSTPAPVDPTQQPGPTLEL